MRRGAGRPSSSWPPGASPLLPSRRHQLEHERLQVYELGNDVEQGRPREVPPGTVQADRPAPVRLYKSRHAVVVRHTVALRMQVTLVSTLSLFLSLSSLA